MRIILLAVLLAANAAAPAQNAKEEAEFGEAWREASARNCAAEAARALPDKDFSATCGCIADSYAKGKTREQLRVAVTPADLGPHEDKCLKSHPPRQK